MAALVARIDDEQGRLDVLVNDIWGGEKLAEWDTPLWEHDLDGGLRMLRLAIDTHLITSHYALPLLIGDPGGLVVEMTDGTLAYNAENYRLSAFYDLAKWSVLRLAFAQGRELERHGCDRRRADAGLAALGDDARDLRRHRGQLARGEPRQPALHGDLRVPALRRARRRGARRRPGSAAPQRRLVLLRRLAREYGFTDVDGSQPDCWRYMVEVQDAGLPPDATGYR